ncbi:amino acid oxidase [Helicobacter sp. MIT 00-7814]|uniref:FAD-dependent oxidoreductase n=1 Tax=unclassified Helicobacter TaxID=2593540 RepID=UPI000E1EBB9C|nr:MULTISPECIES: FAD-dependent oxidoreductase [unclassified Helicobacter]RDU53433.1 amino acid oxidase [Helicobacter sp. MIT 99-10781]RDU53732.1 amino acid oxidase [Helicobacter sp. MIT 00-7814]
MKYDCIIIGGGFYGCSLAVFLQKYFDKILIIERESELLTRASFSNQARVHGGYHYPRSLLTAHSSMRSFTRFCKDYKEAIVDNFDKYYGIARIGSKTSAKQFYHLFSKMHAPIKPAPKHIKAFFNQQLIEEVFLVRECAFDSVILKQILERKLFEKNSKCEVRFNLNAQKIWQEGENLALLAQDSIPNNTFKSTFKNSAQSLQPAQSTLYAKYIFNCTYAGLNTLLKNSNLPLLDLKAEITEMALVSIPKELENLSITIMDGAFFSLMPFPALNSHTLSHVRYTPHASWRDKLNFINTYDTLATYPKTSNFPYMLADAKRYMPILKNLEYQDSLFEIKIVRMQNESDDGRPIVFTKDYGLKNFSNILGGKIDNIYDILQSVESTF